MKFEFEPVGVFSCPRKYRFETPRQGAFADNSGVIVLNEEDPRLAEACRDLNGVERIWVIFCFHLNSGWRPFIQPPVSPGGRRVSTLATRAPYRPNPIGMSCVELVRVEKNKLYVRDSDLLDGTPVLDIKPYIPAADAFPMSRVAWLDEAEADKYSIEYAPEATARIEWLRGQGGPDLENFCSVQLAFDPFNRRRKRVREEAEGGWSIGCRTWRIYFTVSGKRLTVHSVRSHYTQDELASGEDKYGDKALHRAFAGLFR